MISINDYKIDLGSKIREGFEGQIFKCKKLDVEEELFAEQIITSSSEKENNDGWKLHSSILSIIKNKPQENILKIYDILQFKENVFIISESYDQTLVEYKKQSQEGKISEAEIKDFIYQIAEGYRHLLHLKIVQGDLRDETIVIKKNQKNNVFKIAFFKNSISDQVPFSKHFVFRPLFYQAPEFQKGQQVVTQESDIYSLGLILHDLCYPKYLKQKISTVINLKSFHNLLKNDQFELYPNEDTISNELKTFLKDTIVYNPENRCKWADLRMPSCVTLVTEQVLQSAESFQDLQIQAQPVNQDLQIQSIQDLQIQAQPVIQDLQIQSIQDLQIQAQPVIQARQILEKSDYLGDYKIIQLTDKGAQGMVYLAKNLKTQQEVILKQIRLDDYIEISREIKLYQILKQANHPNIIQFYDKFENNHSIYLVLEKCEFNLTHYLLKAEINTDEKIIDFIRQIVSGYQFLIDHNILHRDLKPDNIVIKFDEKGQPIYKLIDFGIGKQMLLEFTNTNVGTPLYKAPEVASSNDHNYQCDIYSLGVILYLIVFKQMIGGVRVVSEMNQFYEKIKNEQFKCPIYKNWLVTDLIEKMIVYDQKKRLTWQNILQHPLFQPIELQNYLFNLYLQGKIVFQTLKDNQWKSNSNETLILFCILKFCEQALLMIYKFCQNKSIVLGGKEFYLKNNFSHEIFFDEIKFFNEVSYTGKNFENLENYQNYKNTIPDEADLIQIHAEFKKQYDQKRTQLQHFQDQNISNMCKQFYNIFQDQSNVKLLKS